MPTTIHKVPFHSFLYPLCSSSQLNKTRERIRTPSFIYNNLVAHDNVHALAYVHKNDVQWLDIDSSNIDSLVSLNCEDPSPTRNETFNPIKLNRSLALGYNDSNDVSCFDMVYSKKNGQSVLVVCKGNSFILYDATRKNLLATHQLGKSDLLTANHEKIMYLSKN